MRVAALSKLIHACCLIRCQLTWLTLFPDVQAFLVDAADHTTVSHVKSVEFVGITPQSLPVSY